MNALVTISQTALTALFIVAGGTKLALSYERFVELPSQGWAHDFRPGHVRLIGLFEVGAAVASAVSLLSGSARGLAAAAAVAMALVMAGAMSNHLRRSEYANMLGNTAWLAVALFVASAQYRGLVA